MRFRRTAFLIVGSCLYAATALTATFTWTGKAPAPGAQDWFNVQNWSPSNNVPGAGDTAIIVTPGVVTIHIGQAAAVANLTAVTVTFDGVGSLTVSGTLEAQNAVLGPSGGTTILGAGTLNVDPVPGIAVYNTTTLAGPLTVNGSANVSSNAVLNINAGVTAINNRFFTLADGAQLAMAPSGGWFINNSSFTGGNSVCTTSSSTFSNAPSGAVYVNAGKTLQFQGTLANSGVFNALGGGTISIGAVTALFDGASFTGSGTNLLTGADTLTGNVTVTGILQFNGTTLTLNGTLEVAEGGYLTWLAGTLAGVGTNVTGRVLVDLTGQMLLNELGTLTLRNAIVTNNGVLVWSSAGTVFMGYNARIDNNYLCYVNGDGSLAPLTSGDPGYAVAGFYNEATTYKKGATNFATTFSVPFYCTIGGPGGSSLYLDSGNVILAAGGSIAQLTATTNTSVQLTGGNFSLTSLGSSIMRGDGAVMLKGGTLNIASNQMLSISGVFNQSGGTIYGYGELGVYYGTFNWLGGTIALTNQQSAIYISGGIMSVQGGGNTKTLQCGEVHNNGTINWVNDNAGGGISAGDGAAIYNAGQFNCQCDASIGDISSTIAPVFTNAPSGTITKSGGTGTTYFGILFVNQGGTLQPNQGTIELVTGYRDLGSSAPASQEINLGGGTLKFDRPVDLHGVIGGHGMLSGTITNENWFGTDSQDSLSGNLINNGTEELGDAPGIFAFQSGANFTQQPSGTLVLPIRGTNAATPDFGQVTIAGYGEATLAGTLQVQITDGYAPPVGATFPFLTSFQRNGTFNNVVLPPGLQLNYTPGGATLVVTGAVPVQIISPAVTNGQFQFGFNTISNRSYTVQYEDNLTTGTWTFLTNFIANGSYWQPSPPLPLAVQRFYRVLNP